MKKLPQLICAARDLIDAAEPISQQHAEEPEEYVIPVGCLEDLRTALMEINQNPPPHQDGGKTVSTTDN